MPVLHTYNSTSSSNRGGFTGGVSDEELKELLKTVNSNANVQEKSAPKEDRREEKKVVKNEKVQSALSSAPKSQPKPMSFPDGFGELNIEDATTPLFMKNPFNLDGSVNTNKKEKTEFQEELDAISKGVTYTKKGRKIGPSWEKGSDGKYHYAPSENKRKKIEQDVFELESYNRRIQAGDEFSQEEQNRYNDLKNNVDVFNQLSDPVKFMEELNQLVNKQKEQLESVEKPESYYSATNNRYDDILRTLDASSTIFGPAAKAIAAELKLADILSSAWAKSYFSTYMERSNQTQASTAGGKVLKSEEFKDLIDKTKTYMLIGEQLKKADALIEEGKSKNIPREQLEELYGNRQRLLQQFLQYKDYAKRLETWQPTWWEEALFEGSNIIDNVVSKPLGWINEDWADSFSRSWNDTEKARKELPFGEWVDRYYDYSTGNLQKTTRNVEGSQGESISVHNDNDDWNRIRTLLDKTKGEFEKWQTKWTKEYQDDLKDVEDWKNGNNWTGGKFESDNYFKAQEQLSQMNGMDPLSSQSILFGSAGLVGASNSSWYKTVGGAAARLAGSFTPGGWARKGALWAASFSADMSQGSDENNAEVFDAANQKFESLLKREGLYRNFINEGLIKLKDDPDVKALQSRLKAYVEWQKKNIFGNKEHVPTEKDAPPKVTPEDLFRLISEKYIAQVWRTDNPEINKQLSSAIIGTNSMYYDDLYATCGDAAIDASLWCIPAGRLWRKASKIAPNKVGKVELMIEKSRSYLSQVPGKIGNAALNAVPDKVIESKIGEWLLDHTAKTMAISGPLLKKISRLSLAVASEQNEEVAQQNVTNDFLDGQYDSQTNTSFTERIVHDFINSAPVVADYWTGGHINGLSDDHEMLTNMNGATILSLPMFLGVNVPVMIRDMSRRYGAAATVEAVMQALKQADRSLIQQDAMYASKADESDVQSMKNMFGIYDSINKRKLKAVSDNTRSNDLAMPQNLVDDQMKRFDLIVASARNLDTKLAAIRSGITADYKSQDYQKFVAIRQLLNEKVEEAKNNDKNSGIEFDNTPNDIHEQRGEYLTTPVEEDGGLIINEEDENQSVGKDATQLAKIDSLISRLKAAYLLKKTYGGAARELLRDNYIANNIDKEINRIKKELSDSHGIKITEEDQIDQHVTSAERVSEQMQKHNDDILNKMSVTQAIDTRNKFEKNAKSFIDKYDRSLKKDKELEAAIEKAFNDEMINKTNAAHRQIVLGDTYVASDGKTYEIQEDPNHPGEYIKYEIDPSTKERKTSRLQVAEDSEGNGIYEDKETPIVFNDSDRLDYHEYKTEQEKKAEEAEKEDQSVVKGVSIVLGSSGSEKNTKKEYVKPESKYGNLIESIEELPADGKRYRLTDKDRGFEKPSSEKVDVQYWSKPWRNNHKKINETARVYIKGKENAGYFELVKSLDKNGKPDGVFDIHFKPANGNRDSFTDEERAELFKAVEEMIPVGGKVSTRAGKKHGITKGGVHGLDRFFKDFGFKKVGERDGYDRDDNKTKIPIYEKQKKSEHVIKGAEINKDATDQQKAVIRLLQEKREKDEKAVHYKGDTQRTSFHYFIRLGTWIHKFLRVHGLLESHKTPNATSKLRIEEIEKRLSDLQAKGIKNSEDPEIKDPFKEYKDAILLLQIQLLEELDERFGLGSVAYIHHARGLDFSNYISNKRILADQSIPNTIAQIAEREIPSRAVIAGSIIDEIKRDFFAGKDIEYKPEYMMSKEAFERLIYELQKHLDRYNSMGWILDTHPYIWHTKLPNGKNVAGETDMIAIKPDGSIAIVDFKTTKVDIKTKIGYVEEQEDADGYITQETVWVNDESEIPTEYRNGDYVYSSDYIENIFANDGTTQVLEYSEQLALYSLMIKTELGLEISDIELLVTQITHEGPEDEAVLNKITSVEGSTIVNLTDGSVEGTDLIINKTIKTFSGRKEVLTIADVGQLREDLDNLINAIKNIRKPTEAKDLVLSIHSLLRKAEALTSKLNELRKKKNRREDPEYVESVKSAIHQIEIQIEDLTKKVELFEEKKGVKTKLGSLLSKLVDALGKTEENEESVSKTGRENAARYIPEEGEVASDVTEEDRANWFLFNTIAGLFNINTDKLRQQYEKLLNFNRHSGTQAIATAADFVKNSKFFISFVKDNNIDKGYRFKVKIVYKGKAYGLGKGFLINDGYNEDDSPSTLCKNLRIKYYELAERIEKLGHGRIVATVIERTNGKVAISSTPQNVYNNQVLFGQNKELLDLLICGEDSLLGVVHSDALGNPVIMGLNMSSNEETPTYYQPKNIDSEFSVDENGNERDSMVDGTVVFLHKFRYDEDPEGEFRTVPVAMVPDNLYEHEIDLIINLLQKGYKNKDEEFEAIGIDKDGNSRKVTIPGLRNVDVINFLVRFGGQANITNNKFIFEYARFTSGKNKGLPMLKKIRITDMRQTGDRSILTLDLTNENDIETLREILSFTTIHINNQKHLRHGLNRDLDKYTENPFGPIFDAFVDNANSDIETIVLTDQESVSNDDLGNHHLVFDQEDMSFKDAEKSSSGAKWMIKHGMMTSDFLGLENPSIAIMDLGIVDEEGNEIKDTEDNDENSSGNNNKLPNRPKKNTEEDDLEEPERRQRPNKKRQPSKYRRVINNTEDEDGVYGDEQQVGIEGEQVNEEEEVKPKVKEKEKEEPVVKGSGESKTGVRRRGVAGSLARKLKSVPITLLDRTKKDRKSILKELKKVFGKNTPKIKWFDDIIERVGENRACVGAMLADMFELSELMPAGTHYHEMFHRVVELLIPTSLKLHLEDRWRKRNGNKSEFDVSEEMADEFMLFKNNLKLVNDIKTRQFYKKILNYAKELKKVKDWQLAALYMAIDSGVFRFIKPTNKRLARLQELYGGVRRFTLEDNEGYEVQFTQLNDYTGLKIFNEFLRGLIRVIIANNPVGSTGENAYVLNDKSSFENIKKLNGKKEGQIDEKTGMSHWFIAVSGFYINEGVELTNESVDQLITMMPDTVYDKYYEMAKDYIENNDIEGYTAEQINEMSDDEYNDFLQFNILPIVVKQEESKKTSVDQLEPYQKVAYEAFSNWDNVARKYLEQQFERFHMNVRKKKDKEERATNDAAKSMEYINTESYEHSRIESLSEQILFFLSQIPDKRWATLDDVDSGMVSGLYMAKSGIPGVGRMRSVVDNLSSQIRLPQFLRLKEVSTRLLVSCHDCQSVEELIERLNHLATEDPMFYYIAKRVYSKYQNSIRRYTDGEIILYTWDKKDKKGLIVKKGSWYQKEDENGNIKYYDNESNKEIENARVLVDYANESFVTELFQYIRCQLLEFDHSYIEATRDENGRKHKGSKRRYNVSLRSGDSVWAAMTYPKQWFRFFKSDAYNIFHINKKGHVSFVPGGKDKLYDAAHDIYEIYFAVTKREQKIDIGTEEFLDTQDPVDFEMIVEYFVDALNLFGIDVTIDEFKYFCCWNTGNTDFNIDTLRQLFNTKNTELSIKPFISTIGHIEKALNLKKEKGVPTDYDVIFGQSRSGSKDKSKKDKGYVWAKGENLFSELSFVKELAKAKVRHDRLTRDLSSNAPGGKKRYTMTECNTASDITDDINRGEVIIGDNGQLIGRGSKMLKMMIQYGYTCLLHQDARGRNTVIGSLLAKAFFNQTGSSEFTKPELRLVLVGGSRTDDSKQQGVSYTDQSTREDIINKMNVLHHNGILFPTLSDKATYFFLKGLQLVGFNYNNIKSISKDQLPLSFLNNEAWYLDCSKPQPMLDQLIEYARCEHEEIKRNLERQGLLGKQHKISNFSTETNNSTKYGFMIQIFKRNEKGVMTEYRLDNTEVSDEDNWKYAENEFFSDKVSDKERRMSVLYALLQITLDQLDLMESNQIIKKDKNGFYSNVGLDNNTIVSLTELYESKLEKMSYKDMTESLKELFKSDTKQRRKYAEHLAIIAYTTDIQAKSVQSEEETERFYTGLPHFFKWKYGTKETFTKKGVKKVVKYLSDRYSDQSKRHGGLGSTGNVNRRDLPNIPKTYSCAEFLDHAINSEYSKQMREAFMISEYERAFFETLTLNTNTFQTKIIADRIFKNHIYSITEMRAAFSQEECEIIDAVAEARSNSFVSDNPHKGDFYEADGAAYITPQMAENLLRMRGAFTEEVAAAFAVLDGSLEFKIKQLKFGEKKDKRSGKQYNKYKKYLSKVEAYEIVKNALIGSQKYSAYGVRLMDPINGSTEDGNSDPNIDRVPIHFYNKYALFPLFPDMCTGYMTQILQQMEDQGVDMLLSNQAVKAGGCSPQVLNEDTVSNVEFVKYELDYDYIRRQMNTDPHEGEKRSLGTQVAKVALSAIEWFLDYNDRGTELSGMQLARLIMSSMNHLATIGEERLRNKFFNKDGSFNTKYFSKFLQQQLENREADSNLIDALKMIGDKLKMPIEATSSASWMESILASRINKDVVDINLPGNAFYQRSIFGHEGGSVIGKEMYNGKHLKTLNEKGSMDAVISIDYFDNIIPKSEKGFKARRKWLLDHNIIGENADATTIAYRIPTQAQSSVHPLRFVDVVDVVRDTIMLPKDFTAITGSDFDIDKLYLFQPNFNKKTNTYQFTEEEDPENYWQNELVFGYLAALHTSGHMQTVLKEVDGEIITEEQYFPGQSFVDTYGSIDGDTNLSKNVLKRIESRKGERVWKSFEGGSLAYLIKQKEAFLAGKEGIGPFALNNNSLILTQLFGVEFKKYRKNSKGEEIPNMLSCLHATSLANRKTKRGNKVLSWLSGFINAHVDVAKDPWITRLNVNRFTWNLTNLLTRIGLDDGALFFVAQPIIKEMSKIADANHGEFLTDTTKSEWKNTQDDIKDLVERTFINKKDESSKKRYLDLTKDTAENEQFLGQVLSKLLGIDENGEYPKDLSFELIDFGDSSNKVSKQEGCILFHVLNNPDALINPEKDATLDNLKDTPMYQILVNGEEILMSPKDVLLYVYASYLQLLKYENAMSDLVNISKIDTKKQGKNFIEQEAYRDKYENFVEKNTSEDGLFEPEGISRMFEEGDYLESFIPLKTRLALDLFRDIVKQFSFPAKKGFKKVHAAIMREIGADLNNQVKSRKVTNAIRQYIKAGFFYGENGYIKQLLGRSPKSLLAGDFTVCDMLVCVKNSIKAGRRPVTDKDGNIITDEEGNAIFENPYSDYGSKGVITNTLLKCLMPDVYEQSYKDEEYYKFIYCEGAMEDDREDNNDIEAAWDYMLSDNDTVFTMGEHTFTMAEFAKCLVAYSFITSGDQSGQTKFFKYVPNSWRTSSRYSDYIDQKLNEWDHEQSDEDVEDIIEEILRNNWTDPDFVKFYELEKEEVEDGESYTYDNGIILSDVQDEFVYTDNWVNYRTREPLKGKKNIDYMFAAIKLSGKVRTTVYKIGGKDGHYPMFLSAERRGSLLRNHNSKILYKLVVVERYYYTEENEEKFIDVPVYAITMPKGRSVRSGTYSHNIIQYGDNTQYQQAYTINKKRYNEGFTYFNQKSVNAILDLIYSIDTKGDVQQQLSDIISENEITLSSYEHVDDPEKMPEMYYDIQYRNMAIMLELAHEIQLFGRKTYSKLKNALDLMFEPEEEEKEEEKIVVEKHPEFEIRISEGGLGHSLWQKAANKYGITFKTSNAKSVRSAIKDEVTKIVKQAVKSLNKLDGKKRKFKETMNTLYIPIKYSDKLIAIGTLDENTQVVSGEQGYVVQMAIEEFADDNSVFLYDLNTNRWMVYDLEANEFKPYDSIPTLDMKTAVTSTSESKHQESAQNAINSVLEATITNIEDIKHKEEARKAGDERENECNS